MKEKCSTLAPPIEYFDKLLEKSDNLSQFLKLKLREQSTPTPSAKQGCCPSAVFS